MVSGLRREPLNQSIENMYKMIDPKVEFHHVSSINHGWRLKFWPAVYIVEPNKIGIESLKNSDFSRDLANGEWNVWGTY